MVVKSSVAYALLFSSFRSNLLFLKRSTATGFISNARDSIGLGFGTNTGYTVYAFATMSSLAAEQFLLARGQVRGQATHHAMFALLASCLPLLDCRVFVD